MTNRLVAFDLKDISQNEIKKSSPWIPQIGSDMKKFIFHCIGSIHSIASVLHHSEDRGKLRLYFGRSSESYPGLINRWRDSRNTKKNQFGIILCTLPTNETSTAERAAIRIFKILRDNNTICVGDIVNVHTGSAGPQPNTENSFIYVTWRLDYRSTDYIIKKPSPSEIVRYVSEIELDEISKKSLKEIFEMTKLYTYRIPVEWNRID